MPISPAALSNSPREKNIAVSRRTVATGAAMPSREENSTSHFAKRFATGLVTGNADDVASLSGTVAGDLFVFGDIRDVVREGKHLAMGEDTDRLVLGLAAAGLAVTAATYVSVGGAAPVRAGLTLVKDARKVGRLGEGLTDGQAARRASMVDAPMLQNAVASGSVMRPGQTVERDQGCVPCREGRRAGAARQGCRPRRRKGRRPAARWIRCGSPRARKMSPAPHGWPKSKGGQTRAILKMLGRGALLLTAGAFNLALWVFGAVFALFGLLSSIKATTERLTQSWLDRRKARRLREQLAGSRHGKWRG